MEKLIQLTKLCPKGFGLKYEPAYDRFEIVYNLKKNYYSHGKTIEDAAQMAIDILSK